MDWKMFLSTLMRKAGLLSTSKRTMSSDLHVNRFQPLYRFGAGFPSPLAPLLNYLSP